MKGDFSRLTFDPCKHYSSVRMQQGRVQLDADWNEQQDITAYRIETEIKDFLGQSGAPEAAAGFAITAGGALDFDGQDDYVDLGAVPGPASNEALTVELWFKWDGNQNEGTLYQKYGLYEGAIQGGYFRYKLAPNWSQGPYGETSFKVDPGRWYHVAVVYDKSNQYIYRNGELVFSRSQTVSLSTNARKLLIGVKDSSDTTTPNLGSYFDGMVDEVRIWKRARAVQEIKADMCRTLAGDEQGLAGYWRFDERSGQVASDSLKATPVHNGALMGSPAHIIDFWIGAGRYYIDGLLIENHEGVRYTSQPGDFKDLPKDPGDYLFYLDVWQRHITALEDPAIRESALGEPDTATRVKNVWQVKHLQVTDTNPEHYGPGWAPPNTMAISSGRMTAQTDSSSRLENRLYRVEIHGEGAQGQATYKWSRDNGSVALSVESLDVARRIVTISSGDNLQTGFAAGDWIELSDEGCILAGKPGILAQIKVVDGNKLTLVPWPSTTNPSGLVAPLTARRWDSGATVIRPASPTTLEDGITVTFTSGTYKTGDYWLIPARALNGIEWPRSGATWLPQPPHGVLHHYCPLVLVQISGTQINVTDLRTIFKPMATGLVSKAGDVMSGPLTVRGNVEIGSPDVGAPADGKDLTVYGNIYYTGICTKISSGSDARWKKNITPITDSLDQVLKLRGVSFAWRAEEYPNKYFAPGQHLGVIAQEVEKVVADLVTTDGDGYKTVEYNGLIALLIEAIKDLKAENTDLRQRIDQLERAIHTPS